MEDFKVLKVSFDKEDFQESLEDKFFTAKIIQSCEKIESKQELRMIIEKLAQLAAQRQGVIRGLCMRLARLECQTGFNLSNYSDFIDEINNESNDKA